MESFKVIAITHKHNGLEEVGKFHLSDNALSERLHFIKQQCCLHELMYLSTCNRVEFYFTSSNTIDTEFLIGFFNAFNPSWSETQLLQAIKCAEYYNGEDAVRHVFNVASSLDSMVVGEREIITQVREAFERSKKLGLTGDTIRLVVKKTIETAKEIYSKTNIATKPVSVVSLAFKKLQENNVKTNSRILLIGAGQTNTTMARFLKKYGFTNFVVFNRSLNNAQLLAKELNCEAKELSELSKHAHGFDVLITCTSSADYIITTDLYQQLLNQENDTKIIIDLAIPTDVEPTVHTNNNVKYISVEYLKKVAEANLKERTKELDHCQRLIEQRIGEFKDVIKIRHIENAMHDVPEKIKAIKDQALNAVFAKDIASLDENSRKILEAVVDYMEKKYISVPMKMAREIMMEQKEQNEKLSEREINYN